MSLRNDLRPDLLEFLEEDREERARRKEFLKGWEIARSYINTHMQEVVLLLSDQPAFSAEVNNAEIGILLNVTFKNATGVSTSDSLCFAPDRDYLYVSCASSFDEEDEIKKINLLDLNITLVEHKIENFFKRFLASRRYPGMVFRKLSKP
jgi:hypothetical protein